MESEDESASALIREISLPLFQARLWIKLVGVVSVAIGVIIAISIVGLIVAWLPIWMGIVLYRAASTVEAALHTGDRQALIQALGQLRLFFTIMGVVALLWLILFAAMLWFGSSFHMMMWNVPHVFTWSLKAAA